jgi:hypothetical protein
MKMSPGAQENNNFNSLFNNEERSISSTKRIHFRLLHVHNNANKMENGMNIRPEWKHIHIHRK